jgi:hypothetical protein
MKKYLIILFLLIAAPAWGTTYYACGNGNLNDANLFDDVDTCGSPEFEYGGAIPASGDTIEANGYSIAINTDPGPNGKVILNTAAGGGFTATAAGDYTITADIGLAAKNGTTDVLTVGSGANVVTATILGNIYGGGSANADGLVISGSGVTVTIGSVGSPVTITGGGNSSAFGVNDVHTVTTTTVYAAITGSTGRGYVFGGATGSVAVTGNCTGGATPGFNTTAAGTSSVTGDCTGGTVFDTAGCKASSTGAMTITGSLISSTRDVGAVGTIRWTPVDPGSGVGSKIKMDGGGTPIYVGKVTNELAAAVAAKVSAGEYFIKFDDGVSTVGTAASGGGSYGF